MLSTRSSPLRQALWFSKIEAHSEVHANRASREGSSSPRSKAWRPRLTCRADAPGAQALERPNCTDCRVLDAASSLLTHRVPRWPETRGLAVAARTPEERSMTADEIMTSDPATVTPTATIAEAWDLMRELDIRHLPVVDGDALVGMLSDRDLGNLEVTRLLTEEGADALRRQLARPVIQLMSTDVVTAEPETEVSELVTLLLEHKVGAIPVVTPDTRRIVGIVSYIDVLRVLQEVLEPE
jgi:CBS domain-containing protein